jgi:hypothetical protein
MSGINVFVMVMQVSIMIHAVEDYQLLTNDKNIEHENCFSQLLNVHNVSDVRQIEVHTAEPLVPGSSRLEVEIAIAV